MDPTTDATTDDLSQEISPLRSKMASLATRSSFASFFLKNKKNVVKSKCDPAAGKEDPNETFGETKRDPNEIIVKEEHYINNGDNTFKPEDTSRLAEDSCKPIPEVCNQEGFNPITPEFIPLETTIDVQEPSNLSTSDVTIISETKPVRNSRKRSNEEIIISDTEPVTLIDSDIEIILPRRSQRIKTVKPSTADIECISISSDDSDRNKVTDLRRSRRISGTAPSAPVIPLSDYSNMKKLNFARPGTKPPVENIVISDSPVKQAPVPTPTPASAITIALDPPKSPNQSQSIDNNGPPNNINLNFSASTVPVPPTVPNPSVQQVPVGNVPVQSSSSQVVNRPSLSAPAPGAPIVTQVPALTALPTATKVPANPVLTSVNQLPAKPAITSVPVKSAYVPINRTSATSTSPVKSKSAYDYIPRNFNDLDPSLREELMTRLSQRENNSSACNSSTSEPTVSTTLTATETQASDKFVIFNIIQRMVPGTFDPTKSSTGRLLQCNSFTTIFKTTETFGCLKRKIAETLRISPYDLVLTQESSGGAGQSELFDTTRPSTLNIVGKTFEEYDQLNVNIRPKPLIPPQKSKAQAKSALIDRSNTPTAPSSIFPLTSNAGSALLPPAPFNIPFTPNTLQSLQVPQFPPSLVHRLYLYTKSSYNLYKSLQKTKKQQMYDSLTFLQTADEEMSKLSQDPVYQDDDLLNSMDMKMNQSQAAASIITINVKTAGSRNQSHPVKISSTANIAQLLQTLTAEYNITGTRVIFDGDALRENETIGNILEDDDMVEIK